MANRMVINAEKNEVTAPLIHDGSNVIVISDGKAKVIELPEFGELVIKVTDDKIQLMEVRENYKF